MAASMTEIAESPSQYERDLRSEHQDWKRTKDSSAKWSYGSTAVVHPASWWSLPQKFDDEGDKVRPTGKPSSWSNNLGGKDKGNINKYTRSTGRIREIGNQRVRNKVSAREEIDEASRSVLDYLPGSPRQQLPNPMDHVLYSFDRSDSPGRPLTLEVFVKTTGREMEKFVEKEYEVIDGNGDMLKGRKARQNLRRGAGVGGKAADEEFEVDEDGFELV